LAGKDESLGRAAGRAAANKRPSGRRGAVPRCGGRPAGRAV